MPTLCCVLHNGRAMTLYAHMYTLLQVLSFPHVHMMHLSKTAAWDMAHGGVDRHGGAAEGEGVRAGQAVPRRLSSLPTPRTTAA